MKYGRLTLVGAEGLTRDKHECLCDCGKTVFVKLNSLRSGGTKSCGCLHSEAVSKALKKHGAARTTEYASWQLLKDRCHNKNNRTYSYYGGKGISVCDRWINSFENFISDMGMKPSKSHSIERIKGDLDYCPENCKWASKKEQVRNRSNTKKVKYKGVEKPLAEWCEILGLDYNNTNKRIWRGWDIDSAFNKPKRG
tara:strand:+ start:213 stop:800 length:588 start_codon:yes stop_codon:yes gene_type:complete